MTEAKEITQRCKQGKERVNVTLKKSVRPEVRRLKIPLSRLISELLDDYLREVKNKKEPV